MYANPEILEKCVETAQKYYAESQNLSKQIDERLEQIETIKQRVIADEISADEAKALFTMLIAANGMDLKRMKELHEKTEKMKKTMELLQYLQGNGGDIDD